MRGLVTLLANWKLLLAKKEMDASLTVYEGELMMGKQQLFSINWRENVPKI